MAWLGYKHAAKYLEISENDLHRLVEMGEITARRKELPWRKGARWKFDEKELDRWMASGESSKDRSAL